METFLEWCKLSSQEKIDDLHGMLYVKEIEFGVSNFQQKKTSR